MHAFTFPNCQPHGVTRGLRIGLRLHVARKLSVQVSEGEAANGLGLQALERRGKAGLTLNVRSRRRHGRMTTTRRRSQSKGEHP